MDCTGALLLTSDDSPATECGGLSSALSVSGWWYNQRNFVAKETPVIKLLA
jgi:hypothetical protein